MRLFYFSFFVCNFSTTFHMFGFGAIKGNKYLGKRRMLRGR